MAGSDAGRGVPTSRGSGSAAEYEHPHTRRAEILGVIRAASAPLSVTDIAAAVGIHPNTARFHLDALTGWGAVVRTLAEPSGRGRPRALYAPNPGMDRGGARRYESLARLLVAALASGPRAEQQALDAGRAWGARLASRVERRPAEPGEAIVVLSDFLAGLDFAPRHVPEPAAPGHLRLEHCPFLEVAEESGSVVCPAHLGLMQGLLAELDAPLRAVALEPFAEPGACVVRLAAVAAAAADRS